MPARTGLSSSSFERPILPRPSARSVPRCFWVWPMPLRTWVSLSRAIRRLLLHGRLVGQHLADRLAARLRDLLGPAQLTQRHLGRLDHVDRVRRAERLAEDVPDAAELEHGADAAAGDDAGT